MLISAGKCFAVKIHKLIQIFFGHTMFMREIHVLLLNTFWPVLIPRHIFRPLEVIILCLCRRVVEFAPQ